MGILYFLHSIWDSRAILRNWDWSALIWVKEGSTVSPQRYQHSSLESAQFSHRPSKPKRHLDREIRGGERVALLVLTILDGSAVSLLQLTEENTRERVISYLPWR